MVARSSKHEYSGKKENSRADLALVGFCRRNVVEPEDAGARVMKTWIDLLEKGLTMVNFYVLVLVLEVSVLQSITSIAYS